MAKFVFELESVLDIRNFEQRQAESELAAALAEETRINENINQLALQYAASKQQVKNSTNFEDVYTHNQYVKLLDYQKEVLLEQLTQAKIVSEQKRLVVQECMKKTTALEKMKEIKFNEFREEQKLIEKRQLEELAALKNYTKN
ncbi:MAG: flagellar export protein FliJ [Treponema sp.]|nr:flagellar export protein FliJ [Treponema sp.]